MLQYKQQGESGGLPYLDKRFIEVVPELHYHCMQVFEHMYSGIEKVSLVPAESILFGFWFECWSVKQREFDGGLATEITRPPWAGFAVLVNAINDYDAALHVGKYLAKDYGARLKCVVLDNGWQVGLWATKPMCLLKNLGKAF